MLAQMLFSRKKYSLLRELMQAKIGSEEKSSPSSLQLLQQNALFQQMQQRHQNIGNQVKCCTKITENLPEVGGIQKCRPINEAIENVC